jgi:hypothetical protein
MTCNLPLTGASVRSRSKARDNLNKPPPAGVPSPRAIGGVRKAPGQLEKKAAHAQRWPATNKCHRIGDAQRGALPLPIARPLIGGIRCQLAFVSVDVTAFYAGLDFLPPHGRRLVSTNQG